ncbi:tetratricopeptide repeat protein [Krasilnikovia sp. MM14-A1259]|uniref:tetratricopeptide repeat protein n=1 Tax=Krasilnikovia sp. MM14-A1259 TaxID=3373539 RepID=UPI00382E8C55
MEITHLAQVISAAFQEGAEMIARGRLSPASDAAMRSLREILAMAPEEPVRTEDLAIRLRDLSESDQRTALVLATLVLAEIDPGATPDTRHPVPDAGGIGDNDRLVVGHGAGQHDIDAIRQLSRVDEQVTRTAEAPDEDERVSLVLASRSAGHTDVLVPVVEQMLADCERTLGPDHTATVTTRTTLAHLHHSQGRVTEAIEAMQRVVADRRRTQGTEHPDTRAAESVLAQWRRSN